VLRYADGRDKAAVYRQLGLRLTYQPEPRRLIARGTAIGDHVRNGVSEARVEHYAHALCLQERLKLLS